MVKRYVTRMDQSGVAEDEIESIVDALEHEILQDVKEQLTEQEKAAMLKQAKKEADEYKRRAKARFRRNLVYETILVAILTGIAVGAITSLFPSGIWALGIAAIALIVCAILVQVMTGGKDG
jgi:uncharacterized membrane protein YjjP (DUF1212 family)